LAEGRPCSNRGLLMAGEGYNDHCEEHQDRRPSDRFCESGMPGEDVRRQNSVGPLGTFSGRIAPPDIPALEDMTDAADNTEQPEHHEETIGPGASQGR
jgi:hypothetical protein